MIDKNNKNLSILREIPIGNGNMDWMPGFRYKTPKSYPGTLLPKSISSDEIYKTHFRPAWVRTGRLLAWISNPETVYLGESDGSSFSCFRL
jgi:hypothetical protein